jgi:hypothetical protein
MVDEDDAKDDADDMAAVRAVYWWLKFQTAQFISITNT